MKRIDGRRPDQLRRIKVTKNYIKFPHGSCLIEFGDTKVICTATVEEEVPPFLKDGNSGWVTAEYAMIPGSCSSRVKREKAASGRSQEIQRLVGRSLRCVVDMEKLGPRTIKIDCDVIQADGGTRTAAITGGYIALVEALKKIKREKLISAWPLKDSVAAVSVGILNDKPILDLNYAEDSKAEIDMNVVMVGKGEFVEVQGTGERNTFSKKQTDQLLTLASRGIKQLMAIQKKALNRMVMKS